MTEDVKKYTGPIYKDFNDWWSHGRHGWSSASRDIAEATWADFEPTINASRDDYTELMLREVKECHDRYVDHIRDMQDYLREHNLEAVAGVKFYRWLLDRRTSRPTHPKTFFTYKDREFAKVGSTRMKHPDTGKWLDAYQYIDRDSPFTVYTMAKEEFDRKFIPTIKEGS